MIIKAILTILLCLLAFLLFMALIGARTLRKFFHFPAPSFVGYFLDSRLRRLMQPPGLLLQRSGIHEGQRVLEIGCGSGACTTHAARKITPRGIIYGLDIEARMLKQFKTKLSKPANRSIHNLLLLQAVACDLPFATGSLDAVYLVSVLQEIPERQKALAEIRRVLKPGGILAVSELLIDPDYPLKRTTVRLLEQAGFMSDEISGNLLSYTVRFRKPK